MILYLIGGLAAATLIVSGIAGCEHKQKIAERAEKERIQAEYAGFVLEVERKGKAQEKAAAEKEARDHEVLAQQEMNYAKRLAVLRSERDAVQRMLDHYRSASGSKVPGVPGVTGTPEPRPADAVAREAIERFVRDAQETTLMFMECRDSWKAVAGK